MNDLTERQESILRFIAAHVRVSGNSPTMREMARHMCISSTNGVNDHLRLIEAKGYLTRVVGTGGAGSPTRNIRLTDKARAYLYGPACRHCQGTGRAA